MSQQTRFLRRLVQELCAVVVALLMLFALLLGLNRNLPMAQTLFEPETWNACVLEALLQLDDGEAHHLSEICPLAIEKRVEATGSYYVGKTPAATVRRCLQNLRDGKPSVARNPESGFWALKHGAWTKKYIV